MTVKRRKDTANLPIVFMHKVADVRGGVSVASADLGGEFLPEGAVLTAPVNGICHVIKTARIVADAAAADKTVKVSKLHNLAVGDALMAAEGAAAVTVSKIDRSNASYDVLTLSAALGALKKDDVLAQASAAGDKGALKAEPFCLAGTARVINAGDNIDTDGILIGVTRNNPLPDAIASKLKGIINY